MAERLKEEQQEQVALYELPALAVAAHELKAPLALMRQLALGIAEETRTTSSSHDIQEQVERLILTSERSLRLVTMLTRHARLEDGLFALEPVQVGPVCEEVAHELQPLCTALGQSLEVRLPRRSCLAVANRELLRAITLSLCDNALHYTSGASRAVQLVVTHHQGHVRVAVRDHGDRLARDTVSRLQERIGKQAMPIGGRPQSSGLGLYIAGQLAEAMQGSIGLLRHRKAGTTFYVDTPVSSQLSLFA